MGLRNEAQQLSVLAYGGAVVERRAARHRHPDDQQGIDRQRGIKNPHDGLLRLPEQQRL